MTVRELVKYLSKYPSDTRLDFVLLDEDWEDACKDSCLKFSSVISIQDDSGKLELNNPFVNHELTAKSAAVTGPSPPSLTFRA